MAIPYEARVFVDEFCLKKVQELETRPLTRRLLDRLFVFPFTPFCLRLVNVPTLIEKLVPAIYQMGSDFVMHPSIAEQIPRASDAKEARDER